MWGKQEEQGLGPISEKLFLQSESTNLVNLVNYQDGFSLENGGDYEDYEKYDLQIEKDLKEEKDK